MQIRACIHLCMYICMYVLCMYYVCNVLWTACHAWLSTNWKAHWWVLHAKYHDCKWQQDVLYAFIYHIIYKGGGSWDSSWFRFWTSSAEKKTSNLDGNEFEAAEEGREYLTFDASSSAWRRHIKVYSLLEDFTGHSRNFFFFLLLQLLSRKISKKRERKQEIQC